MNLRIIEQKMENITFQKMKFRQIMSKFRQIVEQVAKWWKRSASFRKFLQIINEFRENLWKIV